MHHRLQGSNRSTKLSATPRSTSTTKTVTSTVQLVQEQSLLSPAPPALRWAHATLVSRLQTTSNTLARTLHPQPCKETNACTDVDAASFAHEVFCSVSNGESSVMKSAKSCSTAGTMCDTICPTTNVDSIKANAKTMNLPADNIFWGCFTVSELLASRKKCGAGGSSPSLSSTAKFASPAVAAWLRAACGAVLVVACGNVS